VFSEVSWFEIAYIAYMFEVLSGQSSLHRISTTADYMSLTSAYSIESRIVGEDVFNTVDISLHGFRKLIEWYIDHD
jgi:hypothetical protein